MYSSTSSTYDSDCHFHNLTKCVGGYFLDGTPGVNGSPTNCAAVGTGYWSATDAVARTECATGLTTTGSGAGADEAGDCGRKLHLGNDTLHLRSVKKTTPSLNINVGGATYYGNMSTATKGKLRVNSGGTKYSVYDDSM
jgi:hypothetical protein